MVRISFIVLRCCPAFGRFQQGSTYNWGGVARVLCYRIVPECLKDMHSYVHRLTFHRKVESCPTIAVIGQSLSTKNVGTLIDAWIYFSRQTREWKHWDDFGIWMSTEYKTVKREVSPEEHLSSAHFGEDGLKRKMTWGAQKRLCTTKMSNV